MLPDLSDEWVGWGLNNPMLLQDAFFVALCVEDYIGLRELASYGDGESLLGGLLGVRPEHRNRRIGLAMQLRGIAYAKEHGYRLLKTCAAAATVNNCCRNWKMKPESRAPRMPFWIRSASRRRAFTRSMAIRCLASCRLSRRGTHAII
jgi:GNAT superfamily N-acetyltransferase